MTELIDLLAPFLIPLGTLLLGYLADRGLRKINLIKTKTEVESTKISDMEKSLKFWVTASNEMRKELVEMQEKFRGMEDNFQNKLSDLNSEKDRIIEDKESLRGLIMELKYERDEFKILNEQLRETIARQDAKIIELERFIQKQNMKISTLESKLQQFNDNNS